MRGRELPRLCLLILPAFLLFLIFAFHFRSGPSAPSSTSQIIHHVQKKQTLKVFIADLPREFNYGLLEDYWEYVKTSGDHSIGDGQVLSYPDDPLIKQYSAEYWLLGSLLDSESQSGSSMAQRVFNSSMADIIFVPFFATLSAELQLHKARGKFRHKKDNRDYDRQVRVIEYVRNSSEWRRSSGRDHVFVLTDPVAMWHVRADVAPAVLLVVDFGGWYMEDSKSMEGSSGLLNTIPHRQVSVLKDVIVPYMHLLPTLHPSNDHTRKTFLYFKGARHRHRTGLVREKLWAILEHEPGVILEEGFPNSIGQEQALKGMRNSEFCLHPAGDTPTSCRLFDAIASLCIPVIISDSIELPFEGMLDYTEFCIFVGVHDALQPNFLINHLKGIDVHRKSIMRSHMAAVQHMFEYDNGFAGGIGPALENGAVNAIWSKVLTKVPTIKEAIAKEKRKPFNTAVPVRCQCS